MKATVEIEVSGFSVPDAVIICDGHGVTGESVELTLLDSYTLQRLCDEFTQKVFEAAGKQMPPQEAPKCPRCGNYP